MKEPSALLQLAEEMLRRCAEPDFERVLAQRLAHIFDADECMWADLRLAEEVGSNLVLGQQALTLPGPGAINVSLSDHPAVLSYVSDARQLRPRRLSEVASTRSWQRTAAYERFLNGPVAKYQLSIVTDLVPPSVGRGWIMMRSGADFSDDQVLLASWIQPTLKVLSELRRTQFAADGKRLATEEWKLTKRESEVAALLGQGLSADSIGRMLGISPRTVRKHLERVYAKSGLHDRLLVVQRLSS